MKNIIDRIALATYGMMSYFHPSSEMNAALEDGVKAISDARYEHLCVKNQQKRKTILLDMAHKLERKALKEKQGLEKEALKEETQTRLSASKKQLVETREAAAEKVAAVRRRRFANASLELVNAAA